MQSQVTVWLHVTNDTHRQTQGTNTQETENSNPLFYFVFSVLFPKADYRPNAPNTIIRREHDSKTEHAFPT